jgi:NAD(P)-dependent dehydrogenase (short-subunit alcohol dehydrogenase family)
MAAGDGGSIINVSSVGSIRPQHHSLPYCAAKAGLDVLTVGFAQAYAPKVRVNSLMPGPFLTELAKNWPPGVRAANERAARVGRIAEPEEIVGAALFLASEASAYMTGSVLRVDGGLAI